MAVDDPVLLTCAISGAVAGRDHCPAIPYTPSEYAAEARRIVDEGRHAPGHVFNLGHGVLPDTDPGVLTHVVDLVHELTQS